jgi:hypothetical protein
VAIFNKFDIAAIIIMKPNIHTWKKIPLQNN